MPQRAMVAWAGSLRPTSALLAVQPVEDVGTLLVSASPDLSAPLARHAVTRDDFIVNVSGLAAQMQYYYGLAGAADAPAAFRTPSSLPTAFRIAVGACSWSAGNGDVFQKIAGLDPQPLVSRRPVASALVHDCCTRGLMPLFASSLAQYLHVTSRGRCRL
jgi:hypothetical protein